MVFKSVSLKRPILRFTRCKLQVYIHEGDCASSQEYWGITVRCCAYLLWSGVNYTNSESLESMGVRESRTRLCNRLRE